MPPIAAPKPSRQSFYHAQAKKRGSMSPASGSGVSKTRTAAPSPSKLGQAARQPPAVPAENRALFEDEYRAEIVEHMHTMEVLTLASADLMDMQPELEWYMRPYLVDFLVEIHQQFRLRPEVLYLAINIVDRYVSKRVVYKKHYQLVGCAALWIAAKFEDAKDRVPTVKELAEMCCKAYDESAFIQMEGHVLSTIGWAVGHPTAEAWMRLSCMGTCLEDTKTQHVARFIMEITLFHREFVGASPSLIAAGALMLARFLCGKPRRSPQSHDAIVVGIAQALDLQLAEHLDGVSDIVIRKYAPAYYSRASTVTREWYLSGRRFVYITPSLPVTPVSHGFSTSTWPRNKLSYTSSPGYGSSSSSDCGDDRDEPVTPITPVHSYVVDPFSAVAKENIAPVHVVHAKRAVGMVAVHHSGVAYGHSRPALLAINSDHQILPGRNMRRLSN